MCTLNVHLAPFVFDIDRLGVKEKCHYWIYFKSRVTRGNLTPTCSGGSAEGTSPSAALRTEHEPLDSSGSHHSAPP
jgi:hypothetical protein